MNLRFWRKPKPKPVKVKDLAVKIQIEGVWYPIPVSFEQVSFEQYRRVLDVFQNEALAPIHKILSALSVLTGIPYRTLMAQEANLLGELLPLCSFVWEYLPPSEPLFEFEWRGQRWFLKTDLGRDSFATLVDLEEAVKAASFWDFAPKVLSILLRPAGETYYTKDVSFSGLSRLDLMRQLPIAYAYPAVLFFCDSTNIYDAAIRKFIPLALMMTRKQRLVFRLLGLKARLKSFIKNGVGIPLFRRWRRMTSRR